MHQTGSEPCSLERIRQTPSLNRNRSKDQCTKHIRLRNLLLIFKLRSLIFLQPTRSFACSSLIPSVIEACMQRPTSLYSFLSALSQIQLVECLEPPFECSGNRFVAGKRWPVKKHRALLLRRRRDSVHRSGIGFLSLKNVCPVRFVEEPCGKQAFVNGCLQSKSGPESKGRGNMDRALPQQAIAGKRESGFLPFFGGNSVAAIGQGDPCPVVGKPGEVFCKSNFDFGQNREFADVLFARVSSAIRVRFRACALPFTAKKTPLRTATNAA